MEDVECGAKNGRKDEVFCACRGGKRGSGWRWGSCETEEEEMFRDNNETGGLSWWGGELVVGEGDEEIFPEYWFSGI